MEYECPNCGADEQPAQHHFGPPGDGRNMERYCPECGYHGLKQEWGMKLKSAEEGDGNR